MTTIGTIQLIATIDTSQYMKGAKQIDQANKSIETSADKSSSNADKSFSKLAKVGIAAVAAAAVAAGFAISKNIGNAVARVDTLNNFPKVMQNLGYGVDESSKALEKLDNGVRGLPTSLNNIASAMQNIAPSSKSLDEATELTLALNNALLAGGKDAGVQASAMEQFSQAIAKGKPDMIEWRSLASAMPGQLDQIAKNLGYKQWQQMAEAVSNGELSFDRVKESIVSLNKDGLGELPSFAEQAKNATNGLSTGWANLQTAITRGIAGIIESIGAENVSMAITNLGKGFEKILNAVSLSIGFLIRYADVIGQIATTITILLLPAILRYIALQTMAGVQALIAGARMAAGWMLALGPIGLIVAAVAAAAFLIISNWDAIKNFAIGAWKSIQNAVMSAFNWVKSNWPLILGIITGPFGIAATVIAKNFERIKSIVGNVWEWIKGVFGTIGSVASSIIKAPVNAIIGFAQDTINGFIRAINGAIGSINKIPGVNIGNVGEINIPKLAKGGIITSPTLAMVGEGRESEAVIPLSKLDSMLSGDSGSRGGVNITINLDGIMARSTSDLREISKQLIQTVNQELRSKNLPELGGGAI